MLGSISYKFDLSEKRLRVCGGLPRHIPIAKCGESGNICRR